MAEEQHLDVSEELAKNRTLLSFERTRMAADRTIMAVQRTSLSLIGFGFTIFTFFRSLKSIEGATVNVRDNAPRNFGLTLVVLGIVLLVLGIWQHYVFLKGIYRQREELKKEGLLQKLVPFPISIAEISAIVVVLIGLYAIFSMMS